MARGNSRAAQAAAPNNQVPEGSAYFRLTPQRQRFVDEYLVDRDLNQTQAAIRAGYAKNSAHVTASRLMSDATVQAAIAERTAARRQRMELTQDRVLEELANIALFDPATMFSADGALLNVVDMPERTRRAIASVKARIEYEGQGADAKPVQIVEVKLWNKGQSLDLAMKHLGMLKDGEPGKITIPPAYKVVLQPAEG
jgi:phage terminase small subunit